MTFKRVAHGSGHSYEDNGAKVPGVTTLIGAGLPKPGLVKGATNACAAYVVDSWADLVEAQPSKRGQLVADAWWKKSRSAMARGSAIHSLGDRLATGLAVDVGPELLAPVEQYARWLTEWDVQATHTENPVLSRRWGYAGTFDLLAVIRGQRWLLDIKTGADVWPETALQLAAYRNAEVMLADGAEVTMPEVDACGVVHVGSDFCQLRPVNAGPDTFKAFLYVCQVARWAQGVDTWKGGTSPIGPAVELDGPRVGTTRLQLVRDQT